GPAEAHQRQFDSKLVVESELFVVNFAGPGQVLKPVRQGKGSHRAEHTFRTGWFQLQSLAQKPPCHHRQFVIVLPQLAPTSWQQMSHPIKRHPDAKPSGRIKSARPIEPILKRAVAWRWRVMAMTDDGRL